MAQKRFLDYKEEDSTFILNQMYLGILNPGLYRGFEARLNPGTTLELHHIDTGIRKVAINGGISSMMGCFLTKQGVVVTDDSTIRLVIEPTTTSSRSDSIVANHSYSETKGGTSAHYTVIKGGAVLTSTQTLLGILRLPPNCNSLTTTGVIYEKAKPPEFGGNSGRYAERGDLTGSISDAIGTKQNKFEGLNRYLNVGPANSDPKNYVQLKLINGVITEVLFKVNP